MGTINGSQDGNSCGLYDSSLEKDNCGVGFITRKDGVQTHDVLVRGHEALCTIPHRGGMSAVLRGGADDIARRAAMLHAGRERL